ncbi:MAG: hypothetical protein HFH53_01655 [Hespellia sp.]|nr:hypothetical protein [Hespellia sp.]
MHKLYSVLFRVSNLRGSKCSGGRYYSTDATAFNAPSVAQIGLSPASVPANC